MRLVDFVIALVLRLSPLVKAVGEILRRKHLPMGLAKMMLKVMVKMGRFVDPFLDEDAQMLQKAALPPGE